MLQRHEMQKLIPADERLDHQTPETFATVGQSDLSWTEKIFSSIFPPDGSIQVFSGLGKFTNRNMMDMYAGFSRGREQWTVRAARRLDVDTERIGVGPFDFTVVEPLKQVRFTLRENDVLPFRFDYTCTGTMPCFLEFKDWQREPVGFRISSDLQRYHQPATVEGWFEIDGERTEISREWMGYRTHSWGVRMDVGEPPTDVYVPDRLTSNFFFLWGPWMMRRADGTPYTMITHLQEVDGETTYFNGLEEFEDGTQKPFHGLKHELEFDPYNRRLLGGKLHFDAGWGEVRTFTVEPVSDTGFHYGPGLYFGYKGRRHGTWVGDYLEDGERIPDCTLPEVARELHQMADRIVRVSDGESTGYGTLETIVTGAFPDLGLTAETSFL